MTDDDLHATIDRQRQRCPEAANDLIRFAAEIDHQRQTANRLADQSERLRTVVKLHGKTLERIKAYAEENFGTSRDQHARFVLGTIVNMVNQCVDTERTCELGEAGT